MKRKGIIATLAIIFILLVAYFGVSIFITISLSKVVRIPVTDNPASLGISYQNVSFTSRRDNLVLKGWYLEGEEDRPTIITVHGTEGNRANGIPGIMELVSNLTQEGFNVLMFDLRGHGDSEGTFYSAGYYERRDLLGAVDYLKSRGANKIGVIGFSVGAATAILAAAEESGISAVVSDSGWADFTEIINAQAQKQKHLPAWFTPGYLLMLKVLHGTELNSARPIDAVGRITPRPILFIHGLADASIPPGDANRLYEASNNPSNKVWLVPGATHVKSYQTIPDEYKERVTKFFKDNL